MNRKTLQFATWLMWIAVPLTALRFWLVWDHLPQRMATHFDANWHANGWMPREAALYFALGLTVFMLVVFTAVTYAARKSSNDGAISWVMLSFFYVVMGFVFVINDKVIRYNLGGDSIHGDWLLGLLPAGLIVFMALYLRVHRGQPLPAANAIAEETHSSTLFGFVFLLATIAIVSSLAITPSGLRLMNLLLCALLFVIAASPGAVSSISSLPSESKCTRWAIVCVRFRCRTSSATSRKVGTRCADTAFVASGVPALTFGEIVWFAFTPPKAT